MKQDFLRKIKKDLRAVADKEWAKNLARYFKTGKGEYGEGDKFLGVTVPEQRRIVKIFMRSLFEQNQSSAVRSRTWLREVRLLTSSLLQSPWHEERLVALLILVELYQKGNEEDKKKIFNFYLKNIEEACPVRAKRFYGVNNWDLVDLSAPKIVGEYLVNKKDKSLLLKLAKSKNIWSRRVAVLATFAFIKNNQFEESLFLAKFLLIDKKDCHDLIHKSVGWMLREVGKRDRKVLKNFLNKFAALRGERSEFYGGAQLPRVTLRYAIERFSEQERQKYLR